MLSSDYVARKIQDRLNADGRITFKVTDNIQAWYGYQVKDADGNYYSPCVLRQLPLPILSDFTRTRILQYQINLKGLAADRKVIEEIIFNADFTVDDFDFKFSNLVIDKIENAEDGFTKTREFIGNFRVNVYVPTFVTGSDVKVKIDGVDVSYGRLVGSFDKALIPNREFGENESDVATGEEHILTLPLSANEKVVELFENVINRKYNKTFLFEFDFIVAVKEVSLTLTGGSFVIPNDYEAIKFDMILTKSLPRKEITINDEVLNVIGFTPSLAIVPATRQVGSRVKIRAESYTNNFVFQLENDGSQTANDLVDEINSHTNKIFNLKYEMNGKIYEHDCIVQNGSLPVAENPQAVISVVLGVGA